VADLATSKADSLTEKQLLAALQQAWNGGGVPESAFVFYQGEWVLVDLKQGRKVDG
jgi:hypothetical protein